MRKMFITGAAIIIGLTLGCQQQVDQYHTANSKARWVEAEMNLPAMAAAQAGNKAMSQKYATTFDEMGFSLSGDNQNYSYFMGDSAIKGAYGPATLPESVSCPAPTDNEFKICAVANLDDDPDLDVWTIDQNRNLTHVKNDVPSAP